METIYTIGHSTRPIAEFIDLLKSHSITQLVDIRTIPGSSYNPQFNQAKLKKSLNKKGIEYVYLEHLGGLRPKVKESINDGWHNQSFRNYADYMQTKEFKKALDELIKISKDKVTAIMCAEAVPWRCHRSLVSDALIIRKIKVCEIINPGGAHEHTLTSFAVVKGKKLTYPKSALSEAKSKKDK